MALPSSATVPARIGVLGNPSDGYFGSCISMPLRSRAATVTLHPSATIVWPEDEGLRRILIPTLDEFEDYRKAHSMRGSVDSLSMAENPVLPFRCEVVTTIPRQVGLAGSSAIEMALFLALLEHYGIGRRAIEPDDLADAILRVERNRLGMVAGLQDRLPQAHDRLLHMDFEEERMVSTGRALSTPIEESLMPELWLAFGPPGRDSGEVHSSLPERWEEREPEMVSIIDGLRSCADEGLVALRTLDREFLARLIDRNLDLRCSLFGEEALGESLRIANLIRAQGSCVKQTGSGGALFGIIPSDDHEFIERLRPSLASEGWTIEEVPT